jgi:4-amino-4-deoxy-L-arabinose transferase-like glycosyltransferase
VRQRTILALVVLLYLGVGALYAANTPDWQVPDEPAHYNYVRQLAVGHLPVLEAGDYDQDYMGRLTAERFPAELSVERVEYEDWQPPLYYLLATPVYRLFGGALVPLRLFSLVLGGAVILLAFGVAHAIFPDGSLLPLGAAAFVAFVPQHIAMMAGVNNDSLTEVLVGIALLMAVYWLQGRPTTRRERRWLAGMGVVVGLGLVTKASFLPVAGVVGLAILIVWWRDPERGARGLVTDLALAFVPALLIALPWWLRNAATYGGLDIYGMANHDAVVVGQPRTAQWIADYGLGAWLERWATFTFQSFWGQFGWMGVLMPTWLYRGLALGCVALAGGLVYRLRAGAGLAAAQRLPLLVLGVFVLLVVLVYVYYNVTFVQHQGRYLYPALIPIALGAALGVEGLLRLLRWPAPLRLVGFGAPYLAMLMLDVYALWRIILPALA